MVRLSDTLSVSEPILGYRASVSVYNESCSFWSLFGCGPEEYHVNLALRTRPETSCYDLHEYVALKTQNDVDALFEALEDAVRVSKKSKLLTTDDYFGAKPYTVHVNVDDATAQLCGRTFTLDEARQIILYETDTTDFSGSETEWHSALKKVEFSVFDRRTGRSYAWDRVLKTLTASSFYIDKEPEREQVSKASIERDDASKKDD